SLTQRQAAAHVGISHGHYGDLEAGRRHPSLAVAQRLVAFFDIRLEALCVVTTVAEPEETAPASPGTPEALETPEAEP
ncbi:MAG TPA: helix-turn-helix transcriptional regulator, partial [Iamia sp.]|nr:helix-turn-helix transcriptional regulator [Iamia sp.]